MEQTNEKFDDIKKNIIQLSNEIREKIYDYNVIKKINVFLTKEIIDGKFTTWIKNEADNNNSVAQWVLGKMYHYGRGVTYDKDKSIEWLKLSAENNNPIAQFALGLLYDDVDGDKNPNYKEAFKWYSLSSELEYAPAQFNLAILYRDGLGVEKDFIKAVKLFGNGLSNNNCESYAKKMINLYNRDILITLLINQTEEIKSLKNKITELEYTVPLEGGSKYKETQKNFEKTVRNMKTLDEHEL